MLCESLFFHFYFLTALCQGEWDFYLFIYIYISLFYIYVGKTWPLHRPSPSHPSCSCCCPPPWPSAPKAGRAAGSRRRTLWGNRRRRLRTAHSPSRWTRSTGMRPQTLSWNTAVMHVILLKNKEMARFKACTHCLLCYSWRTVCSLLKIKSCYSWYTSCFDVINIQCDLFSGYMLVRAHAEMCLHLRYILSWSCLTGLNG